MARSVLEILIKATDKASPELKKVDKQLDQINKDAKTAGTGFDNLKSSMVAIGAVVGVLSAVGVATKKVVDDTVAYGKQVDDLSRALGTNTEEASKLIQVADDLRIETGTLKVAFRTALREGVTPNIAGLKQLSEEYKKLETAPQRAQFVLEKFGRSGLEMQKILELDAEALDEMAQSAEDAGLVLSGDAVQATIDYHMATDQLGDSLEGLKTQLGMAIIPVLTESTSNFNKNTAAIKRVKEAYDSGRISAWEFYKTFREGGQYVDTNAELLAELAKETEALQAVEEDEISTKQRFISAMNRTGDATWGAFYALEGMPTVTADMAEAFKDAEGILATAAKNMEKFSLQVLYNKAVQYLDADAAIKLGSELGILDGRTIMAQDAIEGLTQKYDINKDGVIDATEATAEYVRQIQELYNNINQLPAERTIRINMIINENLQKLHKEKEGDVNPWQPGRAGGGYVSPMQPYIVGEAGPELFVPNAAGTIVPNNRLRGGGYVDNRQFVTQHFHSAGAAALGMAIVEEARGKRLDAAMGG